MDEDGVWAELLFPTFPRFGGTQFLEADDKDLALAMVRAWNDWMIDEWCAAYPDRFIPQTLIPLWDVPAAVAEIERCAAKGSRAVLFVENPHPLGLPSFPTGHWRPVFEACNETGLPLSMHIGTSSGLLRPSPETHTVGRHRAVRRQLDERARRPDLQRRVQRLAELPRRAVGGRRRVGAVRARTARLHVGAQPLRGPARTPRRRRRCSRSTSGCA